MLTPQEVSSKEFVKAVFGGYDMSVVDDFLETVAADYTALYKENAILKSKIKVLVEKVEEYRSTDDAMRMALLTAQKLGDEITEEAKRKSEELLSKTEADIRERLQEMKNRFAEEDARLKAVKEETRKFIAISQEIIRQHQLFLSKLEELNKMEPETPPPPEYVPISASDPAPEPPPEATGKDSLETAARREDDAPGNKDEAGEDPFAPLFKDEEAAKILRPKREQNKPDDDDEPTSPRPKFDFNNLKFGPNYSGD